MKRLLIPLGLLLVVFAVVWRFGIGPTMMQRVPTGWEWTSKFIGTNEYADPETGEFTGENTVSTYDRTITIIGKDNPVGSVTLEDRYIVRDVNSGVITWVYPFSAPVDPETGAHVKSEYQGDIFLFPRNVQKTTYNYRAGSYEGLPVKFDREEVIEGLTTYLFSYEGYAEYTESYTTSTVEYSEATTQLEAGQEIRCGDDTLYLRMWVEPLTGEIVKFEEGCPDGDYIYNIATGEKLTSLGRWNGETTGDVVIQRIEQVNAQRNQILLTSTYVPLGAGALGIILLLVGVAAMRTTPAAPKPAL